VISIVYAADFEISSGYRISNFWNRSIPMLDTHGIYISVTIMAPSLEKTSQSERDPQLPARSESKNEVARARLVEAGTRLIAERGIEGVNTNVVARAAKLGVGTFYNHFEDKHALHRAVVMRGFEGMRGAMGEAIRRLDPDGDDIAAQVRAVVAAQIDFALAEPSLFRVAFGGPAPAAAPGQPAMTFSTRAVEQRLLGLQRDGLLDPGMNPEVAARGFAGMQTSVLLWWLDDPSRCPAGELVDTLVQLHPAMACRVG
jgi:AcrR family transcriptional regulator